MTQEKLKEIINNSEHKLSELKAIDYHGALSFETYAAVSTFDPALAPHVLRLIAQTGRMFAERAGV